MLHITNTSTLGLLLHGLGWLRTVKYVLHDASFKKSQVVNPISDKHLTKNTDKDRQFCADCAQLFHYENLKFQFCLCVFICCFVISVTLTRHIAKILDCYHFFFKL